MPSSQPQYLSQASEEYEESRSKYFNSRIPETKPLEICLPSTTAEVVDAMKRAKNCSMKVGVRSGGHLFSCASLVENGLLIDTKNLNKDFVFDPQTKIISFSPGHTVEELANHLVPLKRFFPYGHSRTVGAGGFYLAGGQGCFLRGWGYTCDTWVTQIEVVTADGDVVIANDTANQDLFWAAGGGGLGFFGVLTRIWGRTIPAQKLYDTTIILDTTSIAKPLLEWILYTADKIPRYGSDIFVATFYSDMENEDGGDFSKTKKVFLAINQTMMADTIEQAKVLSSPWDTLPKIFQSNMITKVPLLERTWEDLWNVQEKFQPHGKGERYRVDSILADPGVPYKKLVDDVASALFDLPSRLSTGTLVMMDYNPNEEDQAVSLPQKLSVTTMVVWRDAAHDAAMSEWLQNAYIQAQRAGRGQYVADFDVSQRITKIMTDTALRKWLQIRLKWDPRETFIGYRGFNKSLELQV